MSIDLKYISKLLSHALRHEPESYGLVLDNEGWANITNLIFSLNAKGFNVTEKDITEMILKSEKKRHQILNDKVRALYGHSISERIINKVELPPEILYHGTLTENMDNILKVGLLPMTRQYVHLSSDKRTAKIVASRKEKEIVLLEIKAKEANNSGLEFYKEENGVWLSEPIPSKFINIVL